MEGHFSTFSHVQPDLWTIAKFRLNRRYHSVAFGHDGHACSKTVLTVILRIWISDDMRRNDT